jgi:hypothetical protein
LFNSENLNSGIVYLGRRAISSLFEYPTYIGHMLLKAKYQSGWLPTETAPYPPPAVEHITNVALIVVLIVAAVVLIGGLVAAARHLVIERRLERSVDRCPRSHHRNAGAKEFL